MSHRGPRSIASEKGSSRCEQTRGRGESGGAEAEATSRAYSSSSGTTGPDSQGCRSRLATSRAAAKKIGGRPKVSAETHSQDDDGDDDNDDGEERGGGDDDYDDDEEGALEDNEDEATLLEGRNSARLWVNEEGSVNDHQMYNHDDDDEANDNDDGASTEKEEAGLHHPEMIAATAAPSQHAQPQSQEGFDADQDDDHLRENARIADAEVADAVPRRRRLDAHPIRAAGGNSRPSHARVIPDDQHSRHTCPGRDGRDASHSLQSRED